jgi:hypothetical protein
MIACAAPEGGRTTPLSQPPNYAEAFHAAWSDQADTEKLLAVVAADRNAPAIALTCRRLRHATGHDPIRVGQRQKEPLKFNGTSTKSGA